MIVSCRLRAARSSGLALTQRRRSHQLMLMPPAMNAMQMAPEPMPKMSTATRETSSTCASWGRGGGGGWACWQNMGDRQGWPVVHLGDRQGWPVVHVGDRQGWPVAHVGDRQGWPTEHCTWVQVQLEACVHHHPAAV